MTMWMYIFWSLLAYKILPLTHITYPLTIKKALLKLMSKAFFIKERILIILSKDELL